MKAIKLSASAAETVLLSIFTVSKLSIQCITEREKSSVSAAECYSYESSHYINYCSKKEENSDHIVNQVKLKDAEEDDNNLLDLDFSLDSDSESEK
ncbi:hypothetical protein EMPG_12146 [Blastomyces silverae]|uniref:Uncharacterized protein n=1 Tax=Blastomyces silverae TaxID=2060906 RepID=A0A0H1BMV7_9EURO|nr:hypothetical protein EMPG_12146 [Blastomyces silverae]